MPISIDSTVGGTSANSFVTLSEAQSYMDTRLNESTWESATTDNQNRALIEATRELSTRSWLGRRVGDTQSLSWPRAWVVNPDDPNLGYYADSVVPQRVKDATCELALQFIKAGTTDVAAEPADQYLVGKTIDVLSWQWAEPHYRTKGLARFPRVMALIQPLLDGYGNTVKTVRG